MQSIRALFASIYLISLIFVSNVFMAPDCIGESPHIFGNSPFVDYTRGAFDDGDVQELRAYFDAFEMNKKAEAISHLRNVKFRNVISRSINRTITPIVSDCCR